MGGGLQLRDGNDFGLDFTMDSYPFAGGWIVEIDNNTGQTIEMRVWAVCATAP